LLLFKLFAEMQKASVNFVRSVCLSVRIEELGWNWTDFYEIWFLIIFLNMCSQNSSFIQIWREKRVLYMRTCEDFWSYLTQFFWEWEMFQTKLVARMKKHILCSVNFFPSKLCCLWDNVKEYCWAGQATDDNIIWSMRILCWVPKATDKSSEYVILIAFHCNNGYANTPLYYITHILPVLCWIVDRAVTTCSPVCVHDHYQCFIVPSQHRKTVFCLSRTAATGLVLWSFVCVLKYCAVQSNGHLDCYGLYRFQCFRKEMLLRENLWE